MIFPSINQVVLSGRLTQDPEAKQTESGQLRIAFTVAANLNYTDKQGNRQRETTAVQVCAFDKLAEQVAGRLHQDKAVVITGRLKSRGTALEVVARHIQFLGISHSGEESHAEPPTLRNPGSPHHHRLQPPLAEGAGTTMKQYRLIAFLRIEPEDVQPLTYEEALAEKEQQELLCPENLYRIEELPEKGST